jgi:hypothetical protein
MEKKMRKYKLFVVIVLIVVSLLCSCLEDTQPPLRYTITKGKQITKIKFYHSKGGMLNELILETEENHVKALYQDTTLIIPAPYKSYGIKRVETIYFGDKGTGISFDNSLFDKGEKTGKIQYLILTLYQIL